MRNRFEVSSATKNAAVHRTAWRVGFTNWQQSMGWLSVAFLACMFSSAYFLFFAHIVVWLSDLAIKELHPVLKSHLSNPYPSIAIYAVLFAIGVGMTYAFLAPLRQLVPIRSRCILIAAACVVPPTVLSLLGGHPSNLKGWSVDLQPAVGFLLFAVLLPTGTKRRTQDKREARHREDET